MNTLDCILTRRSIRKYSETPVSEEQIETLLKAAVAAPSARNSQPWHFYIVTNREMLDKLAEGHQYGKMLADASLAILVCGNLEANDNPGYLAQDCSAATQNILLAVHELGLGAVWLGIYPREARMDMVRGLLDVPGNLLPIALISIGRPAEEKPPSNREYKSKTSWIN